MSKRAYFALLLGPLVAVPITVVVVDIGGAFEAIVVALEIGAACGTWAMLLLQGWRQDVP